MRSTADAELNNDSCYTAVIEQSYTFVLVNGIDDITSDLETFFIKNSRNYKRLKTKRRFLQTKFYKLNFFTNQTL